MGKLVLLSLMHGSFEEGFPVDVNIRDEDSKDVLQIVHGKLAANTNLESKYLNWQIPYRQLVSGRQMLGVSDSELELELELELEGNGAKLIDEIRTAHKELNLAINDWLKFEQEFSRVCREIYIILTDPKEEIRFIVNTNNPVIQKIPFFLWKDFFDHYHRAEAGLYLPVKNRTESNNQDKVKILAIFGAQESLGSQTKIRIDNDWEIIKNHLSQESNADLKRLQEPTLDDLEKCIEKYCPQILFFAGHSYSDDDLNEGLIQINRQDSITIEDIKYGLIKAAKKGLKLAIFNSCDGMAIGRQLQDIGISNIIAMREPVPDEVAHRFLRRFLERFAVGSSINLAVRRGRERLQSLETNYPGVLCLPVIWQNPAEPPLTWEQLGGIITNQNNQNDQNNQNNQNSILWESTIIQTNNIPNNLSEAEPSLIQQTRANKNELEYPIPEILRQRYKIIEPIGEGGFSNTYLASDLDLPGHPNCVVKHFLPKIFDSHILENAKRLFQKEAEVLFRLGEHDRIPRLYSYIEENGQFYLVQEFISGKSLADEFQLKARWSEEDTINLLKELLEILTFVHGNNIIHRDIKPSNIIRRKSDGKLFLIDFGAVKEILTSIDRLEQTTLEQTTMVIGTPFYMPPEQWMGKQGKYSDIYALGILGIQAFTDLSSIRRSYDPESLQQILDELKINSQLKYVLKRMVSFDYKNRFSDAIEALDALASTNIQIIKIPPRNKEINKAKKSFLALLISFFIIVLVIYILQFGKKTEEKNIPIELPVKSSEN
jgi:tRNA A-37 threonylcarbamoyl transferase component Bud32